MPSVVSNVSVENLLAGRRFLIEWDLNSPEEVVTVYEIWRSTQEYQGFEKVGQVASPTYQFIDKVPYTFGVIFFYKVLAVDNTGYKSNIQQSNAVSDQTFDDFEEKPFRATTLQYDALVVSEVPGGLVNGTNTVFTTANLFRFGSLQVFIDGVNRLPTTDFNENPDQMSFTFTAPPAANSNIVINYLKL